MVQAFLKSTQAIFRFVFLLLKLPMTALFIKSWSLVPLETCLQPFCSSSKKFRFPDADRAYQRLYLS